MNKYISCILGLFLFLAGLLPLSLCGQTNPYLQTSRSGDEGWVRTMVQTGHAKPVTSFDISPNGRYLVSLDRDLKCCMWDLHTGRQLLETYEFFSGTSIREVSFHKRRSDWVVVTDNENSHILDINSGRRIGLIKKMENEVKVHRNTKVNVKAEGNDLLVFSNATGRQLSRLTSLSSSMKCVKSLYGGIRLLAMGTDVVVCWDLSLGKIIYAVPLHGQQNTLAVNHMDTTFITSERNSVCFRDVFTGDVRYTVPFPEEDTQLNSASFDTQDNLLLATTKGLYAVEQGEKKMRKIDVKIEGRTDCKFIASCYDPMERHFLVSAGHSTSLYAVKLGKKPSIKKVFFADGHCFDIKATPQGILCCGDYRVSHFYRRHEASLRHSSLTNSKVLGRFINYACCPVDKKRIAVGNSFGDLQVFDTESGELVADIREHSNTIAGMDASPDGRFFFTASTDGTVGIWDASRCSLVAKLVYFRDGDNYAIVTHEGYFTASKGAYRGIHFVHGMEVYGFDQFDLQYNRPDKVLSRLGFASEKRIDMLRKVHHLRLKRMGFSEEQTKADAKFHLPDIRLTNLNQIAYEQTQGYVKLQIDMSDNLYPIDRLMVRVNGVPVGGIKGMDLRGKNARTVNHTLDVELVDGENYIEVSCLNSMGAESYKRTLQVKNTAPPIRPNLYILALGASQYSQSDYNLQYADKDAEDLCSLFQKVNTGKYGRIETTLLTDRNVTREGLRQLIPWLRKARIHDTFILFYAGHGLLTADYEQFLATWDMDFSRPQLKGIPYEQLEQLLGQTKAANKLMMVDACHSGYIDKEWIDSLTASQTTKQMTVRFRNSSPSLAVAKVEYKDVTRMYDELFSNTQQESGATILASAGGIEAAMEGAEWKNGLFTSAVIEAVSRKKADVDSDGQIRVQEMQQYVVQRVKQCSKGTQEPNARTENPRCNFVVAY